MVLHICSLSHREFLSFLDFHANIQHYLWEFATGRLPSGSNLSEPVLSCSSKIILIKNMFSFLSLKENSPQNHCY